MGAKLSRHLMSRSSEKQQSTRALVVSSSNNNNDRKSSLTIMEMIKPECLKTKKMKMKKKKKKRVHDEMDPDEKKITKVRKLTLEEWLVASPAPASMKSADHQQCFGTSSIGGGGGELYVFKQFSKKVHPSSSSSSATTKEVVATTSSISKKPPRDEVDQSFSMDDGASANFSSSMCRSNQSGRLKKRVSFKLPDEADIIVFHSPEDKLESN